MGMDFPINEHLVSEATTIKEERRVIRERLAKIEASKDTVSANVYARVKADYQTKLDAASQALLAKKGEVDRELAMLYEAQTKLQESVGTQRHELEELEFRKSLGEFKDADFQKQAEGVNEKLSKFETLLKAVTSNIARYEGLFANEPDLMPAGPIAASTAKAPPARATMAVENTPSEIPLKEALSDVAKADTGATDYDLDDSGGNYFGADKVPATRALTPEELEGDTVPGANGPDTSPLDAPTLKILRGTGAGKIFNVVAETSIGRSKVNTITLREAKVSRQHAVLKKTGNAWIVKDLQSSNGVFVNKQKITESPVVSGDQIQIGDFLFEFTIKN